MIPCGLDLDDFELDDEAQDLGWLAEWTAVGTHDK